jgi:hypothetical protein
MGIGSVVLLLVLLALTGLSIWLHIKNPKHEHLFRPADVIVKEALGYCFDSPYLNELLANNLKRSDFSLSDFKDFLSCPNKSKSFPENKILIARYLLNPDEQKDLLLIATGNYKKGIHYNSIIVYHGTPNKEEYALDLFTISYLGGHSYPNLFAFNSDLELILAA